MGVLKVLDITISICKGVRVLKELIVTVSTLHRCCCVESTDFNSFYSGNIWQF